MLKFNKGQIGATISWVIATVIIIGILIIFIYLSILISKTKIIQTINLQFDVVGKSELLAQKTSFSHQLSGNLNKEIIDKILEEQNR